MSNERKETLIRMLKGAINVCQTAPNNEELGYPYAVGFSLSVIQDVLFFKFVHQDINVFWKSAVRTFVF